MRRKYRIFVRDRGNQMYSGFIDVMATSARTAMKRLKGSPGYWHAILWPPDAKGKRWLHRYVGD